MRLKKRWNFGSEHLLVLMKWGLYSLSILWRHCLLYLPVAGILNKWAKLILIDVHSIVRWLVLFFCLSYQSWFWLILFLEHQDQLAVSTHDIEVVEWYWVERRNHKHPSNIHWILITHFMIKLMELKLTTVSWVTTYSLPVFVPKEMWTVTVHQSFDRSSEE